MNQQVIPPCAAGLTSADLSAWRDETLPADEAGRIAAHHEGCPACQEHLWGFETVAAALHNQRTPLPDERLWQAVRTAILVGGPAASDDDDDVRYVTTLPNRSDVTPIPHPSSRARSRRRRALGTLAAVAAVALVVVGFGRLFQFGANNRPASSAFQLHWKQVAMPTGWGSKLQSGASLSVFPADGSIAWICQAGTKSAPGDLRLWRTSDAGATWKPVQAPPIPQAFNCALALDQLNPDLVILSVQSYVSEYQTPQIMSTLNGGAHWESDPFILPMPEFATVNGTTYAIRQDGTDAGRLEVGAVTTNQNSWQYIDAPLLARKLQPTRFWLNPATGALLVQAISLQGGGATSLWTTDASGNTWQEWGGGSSRGDVAAIPTADGWDICGLTVDTKSDSSQLWCSTKPGAWTMRPGLNIPRSGGDATPINCFGCTPTPNNDSYGAISLLGIADDGAALAVVEDRFDTSGQAIGHSLYRLPAGSSHWQNGGPLPLPAARYTARPHGGLFWSLALEVDGGSSPGPVFTASYPGSSAQPLPTQARQTPTGSIDRATP